MDKKMNWLQELTHDDTLRNTLTAFLDQHGISGLTNALRLYANSQQDYVCRTKNGIFRFKISDIYYLEIRTHNITIYTQHGTYQKYGSLNNEQKFLSSYGFARCNQSCIVSLGKIRTIRNNTITLINDVQLHMSQYYAPRVLLAFSRSSTFR